LSDYSNSLRNEVVQFSACPLVRGTVVNDDQLNIVTLDVGHASDGLRQKFAVIKTGHYH
jgi:hypothetical protein